ncbi:MAG: TOBE domain-containing protein, partial [Aliihoeflea sp.]
DRIAILEAGQLRQVSPARELYERPSNLFAASFIGEMNMLPVAWDGQAARLQDGSIMPLSDHSMIEPVSNGPSVLAVRPERLQVTAPDTTGAWKAKIRDVVYAGAGTLVIAELGDGTEIRARLPSNTLGTLSPGETIGLACPPDAALLYNADRAA